MTRQDGGDGEVPWESWRSCSWGWRPARLAGMATGGRGFGFLGSIVAGVIGALLGGVIGSAAFGWDVSGLDVGSVVLAFLGAVLLLLILRAIPGTRPFER